MTRHKKHGIKLRSMYQWHRYIGITIAVFIIMLAITGILLNHTEDFKLDEKYVQSEWLLNHYGISAPTNVKSFTAKKYWVSQWGNQLYLDSRVVAEIENDILGAVLYQDMVIIAQNDQLYIFTTSGELIERVAGSEGVPSGIEAIGITDKKELAVRAATGIFTTNQDFLFWNKTTNAISIWSDSTSLPHPIYKSILQQYRGKGLTLERVMLDLHSGRLLQQGGVYFIDLVAVLMIFLASSGFWLWAMRKIKRKKTKKEH